MFPFLFVIWYQGSDLTPIFGIITPLRYDQEDVRAVIIKFCSWNRNMRVDSVYVTELFV